MMGLIPLKVVHIGEGPNGEDLLIMDGINPETGNKWTLTWEYKKGNKLSHKMYVGRILNLKTSGNDWAK